jgi:hypothetical protein
MDHADGCDTSSRTASAGNCSFDPKNAFISELGIPWKLILHTIALLERFDDVIHVLSDYVTE